MTLQATLHPPRLAAIGAAILMLVGISVVLLSEAGSPSRAGLLKTLEHPAVYPVATVGPSAVDTTLRAGPYRLHVRLTPNRASSRNTLAVTVTEAGKPLAGARASVSYSMPSMNMYNALTTALTRAGRSKLAANEPVLGMPGSWTMRFLVTPAAGRAFSVGLADWMHS